MTTKTEVKRQNGLAMLAYILLIVNFTVQLIFDFFPNFLAKHQKRISRTIIIVIIIAWCVLLYSTVRRYESELAEAEN